MLAFDLLAELSLPLSLTDAAVDRSRSRSAWPQWRAYSSIIWASTERSAGLVPSGSKPFTPRSGGSANHIRSSTAAGTDDNRALSPGLGVAVLPFGFTGPAHRLAGFAGPALVF